MWQVLFEMSFCFMQKLMQYLQAEMLVDLLTWILPHGQECLYEDHFKHQQVRDVLLLH